MKEKNIHRKHSIIYLITSIICLIVGALLHGLRIQDNQTIHLIGVIGGIIMLSLFVIFLFLAIINLIKIKKV